MLDLNRSRWQHCGLVMLVALTGCFDMGRDVHDIHHASPPVAGVRAQPVEHMRMMGKSTASGQSLAGVLYQSHDPARMARVVRAHGGQVLWYGEKTTVLLPSAAMFEPDSAVLREESFPALDAVLGYIVDHPQAKVRVAANTNRMSSLARSVRLARAQAKRVRGYFWAHGVAFERLSAVGYGELRPIAAEDHVQGRVLNHRIEITLHKTPPESWGATAARTARATWEKRN